jgi:uncharacterized protein
MSLSVHEKRCAGFPCAKFIPFDKPTTLSLPDSDGAQREYPSPGYVSFSMDGQTFTLQPIQSGDGLFFVFRDATTGSSPTARDGT